MKESEWEGRKESITDEPTTLGCPRKNDCWFGLLGLLLDTSTKVGSTRINEVADKSFAVPANFD